MRVILAALAEILSQARSTARVGETVSKTVSSEKADKQISSPALRGRIRRNDIATSLMWRMLRRVGTGRLQGGVRTERQGRARIDVFALVYVRKRRVYGEML